jgi:hypothetical protein
MGHFFMRSLRLAGAALAGVLAFGAAIPAQAATTPGWRQVLSEHYGVAANYSAFGSVLALAKNNAWALGATDASGATTPEAVAEHWNGKTWSAVPMPAGADGEVTGASAASASSIWAVTDNGPQTQTAYVLYWNGSEWSVSEKLTGFGELTGVTAVSARNVWVFGGPGGEPGFGTYHYNGNAWEQVTAASNAGIENGSAVSATNIWAVGSTEAPEDSVYHYNGKSWGHVTAPALSGLQFGTIHAYSVSNVWATAIDGTDATSPSVLVHYNGKTWTRYKLPWTLQLGRFAPDGHGGFWLTGYSFSTTTDATTSYLVHRTSAGVWSRVTTSADPSDLALTPGTASLWGVGFVREKTGSNAVILADGTLP